MVQESTTRFDPPEEGMLPGEEIVWSRKAGSDFFIIFCGACSPFLPFVVWPFIGEMFGDFIGMLALAGSILVMIYFLFAFINLRRIRYYLTSERVMSVRGGNILKQIPLEHFSGRPLGQFFESKVAHTENERPIYRIRIYDPMSDEILTLKGLDQHSASAFARIGDRVECPYCNYDNTALARQCKNCDAVL